MWDKIAQGTDEEVESMINQLMRNLGLVFANELTYVKISCVVALKRVIAAPVGPRALDTLCFWLGTESRHKPLPT